MSNKVKIYSAIVSIATFLSFFEHTKAQRTSLPAADDYIFERPFGFEIMDSLIKVSSYVIELSSFFVLYGILSYFLTADKKKKVIAKKIFYISLAVMVISILVRVVAQLLYINPMI